MLKRTRTLIFISLCFTFVLGCAKEQTQEQKLREETERKYARLSKAAGVYLGYLQRRAQNLVPVELTVTVQNNPIDGQDEPILLGSLRIGLFGGVKIASSSSSFDWGNGRLSFKFDRLPNNSHVGGIEVRANFVDGTLKDAMLDAPKQGVYPMVIARGAKSLFVNEPEMHYAWKTPGAEKAGAIADDALLSVSLRNENQLAPANLDLPFLPGLDATVRFSPLAKTPEVASPVIYDPIDGTLELYFTEVSRLRFDGLFLGSADVGDLIPPTLTGYAALSSVKIANVEARRVPKEEPLAISALPSRRYRGFYQGDGIPFRAEVYFDYGSTQGKNTLEFPFPYFPKMRLELVICVDKEPDSRQMLNLVSIDHLNGVASFQFQNSNNPNDLEMHYLPGWDRLDGFFLAGQGVGVARPRLNISPYNSLGKECADPK